MNTDMERVESVGLEVRVALGEADLARCRELLESEHGLGAGHPAGRQLWQMAYERDGEEPGAGRLVGVLVWAASAWHLADRDEWIGWDAQTRSRRLALIVNNSRLLIVEAARRPNLATQVLGAALRALPGQWERAHGYRPLLAEAFTDLETHRGTSYKASNWVPLGQSKGFTRHRADFYVPNERPKRLWVYPLVKDARERLCARELPPTQAAAEIEPVVRSMLARGQMRSLRDVFAAVSDPRRPQSRRYLLSSMLTLIALGLLCGARTLSDIVRCAQLLGQNERRELYLPFRKGTKVRKVPCYNSLAGILRIIDLDELTQLLGAWLSQHQGILPRTLALDGKDLGAQLGQIVSLIDTTASSSAAEDAAQAPAPPVAMALCPGKGHELTAARALLARPEVDLRGALVTADALHASAETLRQIVADKGGDYLVSLKDNQPKAAEYARGVLAAQSSPLLPGPKRATDA